MSEVVAVELLGLVGEDLFGDFLKQRLADAQVGTSHVRSISGRTGTVISIVDSAGQAKFYSHRGVNARYYGELPSELVQPDDVVYISGYSFQDSESRVTAEELMACGARCCVGPFVSICA